MDITYLGHSCFKLRGKKASVITDPFDKYIGIKLPKTTADIVTISHDHKDHNQASLVSGTSRRKDPFVISAPGEYEVSGVSIFGIDTYHDDQKGEKRGKNTVFVIYIDGIKIAHLGDLGHTLSKKQLKQLNGVDVLLCPVGGVYTIDPKQAVKEIAAIQPAYVTPMHYNRKDLNQEIFGKVSSLEDFLAEMDSATSEKIDKLSVTTFSLPEETELVVLNS